MEVDDIIYPASNFTLDLKDLLEDFIYNMYFDDSLFEKLYIFLITKYMDKSRESIRLVAKIIILNSDEADQEEINKYIEELKKNSDIRELAGISIYYMLFLKQGRKENFKRAMNTFLREYGFDVREIIDYFNASQEKKIKKNESAFRILSDGFLSELYSTTGFNSFDIMRWFYKNGLLTEQSFDKYFIWYLIFHADSDDVPITINIRTLRWLMKTFPGIITKKLIREGFTFIHEREEDQEIYGNKLENNQMYRFIKNNFGYGAVEGMEPPLTYAEEGRNFQSFFREDDPIPLDNLDLVQALDNA